MKISYETTLKIEVLEEFASELIAKGIRAKDENTQIKDIDKTLSRLMRIKDEMYTCSRDELKQKEDELKAIRNALDARCG